MWEYDFKLGNVVFRAVLEWSKPWGLLKRDGTVASLAWCWGQSESPHKFLQFRLLVLGPLGIALGRIHEIHIAPPGA